MLTGRQFLADLRAHMQRMREAIMFGVQRPAPAERGTRARVGADLFRGTRALQLEAWGASLVLLGLPLVARLGCPPRDFGIEA